MFGPRDVGLRCGKPGRQLAFLPVGGAAQQGEVECGDIDAARFVAGVCRTLGVGVGQCVAEVRLQVVGMTLDQKDALALDGLRSIVGLSLYDLTSI